MRLSRSEAERIADKVNFEKLDGLVPVIVQDESTGAVLMQAFMNREALILTLETGLMHYWSRTRRRIWLKGESSKHYSLLRNAILDCDNDAILFKVRQIGPCCHTGKYSCFHKPIL
ncbi:phosphoribosyl-AMP cyclohydrolase [Candidatus Bathyarchaeota archaeon]|nr:MAG: phosphoribosyl-AMP cyclohydrolase [Candidatus Bathyarchaeota archaeon]RLG99840.1 MAG: phosphoribosyl-AMP cyclohydrolase [Candidatus Bathyarchaeota archaeon]RLI23244.1 MAG: phosphoribosyl-AMP cyclohydrolase [Candidatus Bathyarchaeota archaeon]HDN62347.1 phosphoribosyl-AMP cyclohydrolase [Candidatus Bathyarchaeota archaeon]